MKNKLCLLLLCCLFFLLPGYKCLASNNNFGFIIMKPGEKKVKVNDKIFNLPCEPFIKEGVTMVPLRFLSEVMGAKVSWDGDAGKVKILFRHKEIWLKINKNRAMLENVPVYLDFPPVLLNNTVMVPLRFTGEFLGAKIKYLPEIKGIRITPPSPPNRPPVARFRVEKDIVAQGETINYIDESYDPDGDRIVERSWTGQKRAFFSPGEHRVILRVKDSRGALSKPFELIIKVTDKVLMDEVTYNFHYPVPGEVLDISHIPVKQLPVIRPATSMSKDRVLFSNSPETFTEDGILYADVVRKSARIHYHHRNGAPKAKYIHLLAINPGSKTVEVKMKKQGIAGPGSAMDAGKKAAYRFLKGGGKTGLIKISPGENKIINTVGPINPGKCVSGVFDVYTPKDILFSVIVTEKKDFVTKYNQLPLLVPDGKHNRGTFPRGNRFMSVNFNNTKPCKLVIADGKEDFSLYGKDEITGRLGYDKGNYGVLYEINIKTRHRIGILFSNRGGPFAGAAKWGDQVFYLPNSGILEQKGKAALIGVLKPNEEKTLRLMPPPGSYLPVNLIFIPF